MNHKAPPGGRRRIITNPILLLVLLRPLILSLSKESFPLPSETEWKRELERR